MTTCSGTLIELLAGFSPPLSRRVVHGFREEGRVAAPDTPLTGDELLAAVTDAMVALHRRYHRREPVTAKSMLMSNELLACVMGAVYTEVEKT